MLNILLLPEFTLLLLPASRACRVPTKGMHRSVRAQGKATSTCQYKMTR